MVIIFCFFACAGSMSKNDNELLDIQYFAENCVTMTSLGILVLFEFVSMRDYFQDAFI